MSSLSNNPTIADKYTGEASVFISYDSVDLIRVTTLVKLLASSGLNIWWDQRIEPGNLYRMAIQKGLDEAACVVVFWSFNSVNNSFVWSEINTANDQGYLVPVLLDIDARIPVGFTETQYIDLTQWDGTDESIFQKLLQRIESLIKQGPNHYSYRSTLKSNEWAVDNSVQIVSEMRNLTSQIRSLADLLSLNSAAANDLRFTLDEVGKTYKVVNSAVLRFISPAFQSGAIDPAPYLELERTDIKNDIHKGRGSCGMILTRYMRYGGLRDYIKTYNKEDLLQNADEVFEKLQNADGELFEPLELIGEVLRNESRVIVNLLSAGQQEAARQRILNGRTKLAPFEDQLNTSIDELQKIESSLGYVGSM